MEQNTLGNIIHDPDRWDMNRLDRELEIDVLGELPEVSSVDRSDLGQLILFPLFALLIISIVPILLSLNLIRIEETALDRDFPFSSLESPILRSAVQEINTKRRELDLKDVQIRRYQDRVLTLDNSFRIMQELMDDTIQLKEQNLLTELSISLGTERSRLEKSGRSEDDINLLITQFKDELDVRYNEQMEAFRAGEMNVYDQRMTGLRDERASLETALNDAVLERQMMAEDLEVDESELLAQLYEENDFIDMVNAGIDADLEILRESRNIENFWLNELSNQYIDLIDALAAGDTDLAEKHLTALESLFSDAVIADLPDIETRNEADREIVRFFAAYLSSLENNETDSILAETKLLVEQAEVHMEAGRFQEADLAWRRIAVTWPLMDRAFNGLLTTRDELTAAEVRRYVLVSKSSLDSGDFDRASAAWGTSLKKVPQPVGRELHDYWTYWEAVNSKRLELRDQTTTTASAVETGEASIRYRELQNLIRANEVEKAEYDRRIIRLTEELNDVESKNNELEARLADMELAAAAESAAEPGVETDPLAIQWRQYGVIVQVRGETLVIEPFSGPTPSGGTDIRIMRSLGEDRVIHLANGYIVEANTRRATGRLSSKTDGVDIYGSPEVDDLIYVTTP